MQRRPLRDQRRDPAVSQAATLRPPGACCLRSTTNWNRGYRVNSSSRHGRDKRQLPCQRCEARKWCDRSERRQRSQVVHCEWITSREILGWTLSRTAERVGCGASSPEHRRFSSANSSEHAGSADSVTCGCRTSAAEVSSSRKSLAFRLPHERSGEGKHGRLRAGPFSGRRAVAQFAWAGARFPDGRDAWSWRQCHHGRHHRMRDARRRRLHHAGIGDGNNRHARWSDHGRCNCHRRTIDDSRRAQPKADFALLTVLIVGGTGGPRAESTAGIPAALHARVGVGLVESPQCTGDFCIFADDGVLDAGGAGDEPDDQQRPDHHQFGRDDESGLILPQTANRCVHRKVPLEVGPNIGSGIVASVPCHGAIAATGRTGTIRTDRQQQGGLSAPNPVISLQFDWRCVQDPRQRDTTRTAGAPIQERLLRRNAQGLKQCRDPNGSGDLDRAVQIASPLLERRGRTLTSPTMSPAPPRPRRSLRSRIGTAGVAESAEKCCQAVVGATRCDPPPENLLRLDCHGRTNRVEYHAQGSTDANPSPRSPRDPNVWTNHSPSDS